MTRNDFSPSLKVSVVCGDHGRAQFICNHLNAAKLDARSGEFTAPCDVFLFDLNTCRTSLIVDITNYAMECGIGRPIIATLGNTSPSTEMPHIIDVRLSSDSALSLAKPRFQFAQRTAARRAEVNLRRESYQRYGLAHPPETEQPNRDILYVGEASGRFLELKAHLETHAFNLTAAFSSSTAFDYLHDHAFAAILLDTTIDKLHPENFCAMIRRSPNLVELPVLALTSGNQDLGTEILECATDLIDQDTTLNSISDLLLELVVNRGPSAKDFAPPNEKITDEVTGLFTRDFFEDHLERQVEWSLNFDQRLTVLIVRVIGQNGKDADLRDLSYTARVMKTLLRVQDAPTRLDRSTLAVSMPSASEEGAIIAAKRIEGVLDATAFESEPGKPSRQVSIDWRIAELNPNQSPVQLLSSALEGGPFRRGYVAA